MELIAFILIGLYFAPTVIAVLRGKQNAIAISLLNIFLGWTFIGYRRYQRVDSLENLTEGGGGFRMVDA